MYLLGLVFSKLLLLESLFIDLIIANFIMTAIEYTLEEISYSRKEDRRIMESVLKSWLVDPKALNFFSPESKYPFKFKNGFNCIIRKTI